MWRHDGRKDSLSMSELDGQSTGNQGSKSLTVQTSRSQEADHCDDPPQLSQFSAIFGHEPRLAAISSPSFICRPLWGLDIFGTESNAIENFHKVLVGSAVWHNPERMTVITTFARFHRFRMRWKRATMVDQSARYHRNRACQGVNRPGLQE